MVCTYFLLANIVVFGFGRKIKHVMRQTCLNKKWNWRENTIFTFFCLFGKAGLVYIQKSEAQFLRDSKICCRFSFGSYTFNLLNCSELKRKKNSISRDTAIILALTQRSVKVGWTNWAQVIFYIKWPGGKFPKLARKGSARQWWLHLMSWE